jgi:hypothetical protein
MRAAEKKMGEGGGGRGASVYLRPEMTLTRQGRGDERRKNI